MRFERKGPRRRFQPATDEEFLPKRREVQLERLQKVSRGLGRMRRRGPFTTMFVSHEHPARVNDHDVGLRMGVLQAESAAPLEAQRAAQRERSRPKAEKAPLLEVGLHGID